MSARGMVDTCKASGISVATVAKQIASRGMMQRTEKHIEAGEGGCRQRRGRAVTRIIQRWTNKKVESSRKIRTPGASYACTTQIVGKRKPWRKRWLVLLRALTIRRVCRKPSKMP